MTKSRPARKCSGVFQPILKQHLKTLETIRRKAAFENGVVRFDLVDEGYEGFNKFIPYYLYPDTTYSVALTRGSQAHQNFCWLKPLGPETKNPQHCEDLRTLRRGGHAVVGAISFKPEEVDRGREAMREIVEELSQ